MPALQQAAAPATREIAPPSNVQDLEPGLLLFFARPSYLQTWAELFGHEWRHVGVTVQTEHGLRVASYGPRKCFRLDDPHEIMDWYTRVGVARIFHSDAEIGGVERFCRRFLHLERSDSPYTFSSVFVGPVHLNARRRESGPIRTFLFALVYAYCRLQKLRYRDRDAFACSTFIWAAIDAVRSEPLRIPLSAHPDDEASLATPSTTRDELFAQWLCGPTELWQSISESNRCELDLDELVIDLRDGADLDSGDPLGVSDARDLGDQAASPGPKLRFPDADHPDAVATLLRSTN